MRSNSLLWFLISVIYIAQIPPEVEEHFPFQLGPNTCSVASGGVGYKTEIFDKLTNDCEVKHNWVPVSLPFPAGTLAVVSEVNEEKVFIGRMERPDGNGYLIGQVAKSGILSFVDENGKAEEEIVDEKVSLLTVET